ncbi:FadR/GntR family transcriptional regulator [Mariluticola halotolerans]|uniref:FadR/GntR family transcriptional regulator n=1 Tax=Mariluticola halotolerans TaxID=2909283 RepID=UPI0026E1FD74|nr:FadR/GntR family transcriptional regulator [Mariluticola halotolerans]UJQ93110.1 FadR family transcriptional regulator [Mariluticola halotolerans]
MSDTRSGVASIKNRHARVTEELGLAIVRGDFKPGESLPPEIQICEMMGVSRTAIREAIKGLFAKGLVASRPKLGTRVREASAWNHLDPDVLRWRLEVSDTETYLVKMFQLRHATEPAACALAAVNAQEQDCVHIQAAFQAMVDAGDDKNAWVEADLDFHKSIYMATHNEFFWPIGQLFGFGLRHMFNISALGPHRPRAVLEHAALVEAIIGHDPEKARATALTLLENAKKDIDLIRSAVDRA